MSTPAPELDRAPPRFALDDVSVWTHLCARARALRGLKLLLITGSMSLFFWFYFTLLDVNLFTATEMPATWLDRLVPFWPGALVPYASLWVYVWLTPAFLRDREELFAYYLAAFTICAVGMSVFLFWPTTTPAPDIDWTRYPAFEHLKRVDRARNALPSLHACFAVFSAIGVDRLLRQIGAAVVLRWLNVCWGLAIVYSTMATRQHVAVDVWAGVALGIVAAPLEAAVLRRQDRRRRRAA